MNESSVTSATSWLVIVVALVKMDDEILCQAYIVQGLAKFLTYVTCQMILITFVCSITTSDSQVPVIEEVRAVVITAIDKGRTYKFM